MVSIKLPVQLDVPRGVLQAPTIAARGSFQLRLTIHDWVVQSQTVSYQAIWLRPTADLWNNTLQPVSDPNCNGQLDNSKYGMTDTSINGHEKDDS